MRAPTGRQLWLWASLVVSVPATALHLLLANGTLGASPDSVRYLTAAQTIAQERTLASPIPVGLPPVVGTGSAQPTPLIRTNEGISPYPWTVQPPGYLSALAIVMGGLDTPPLVAARIVTTLTGVVILLLAAAICSRIIGLSRGIVAAAVIGILPFFHQIGRVIWSETLFTVFALLCLLFACTFQRASARGWLWFAMASLAAVLATYVRYIGIALYGFLGLTAAAAWVSRDSNVRLKNPLQVLPGLLIYPTLIAPLALRNLDLTNSLTGVVRPPSRLGSLASIRSALSSFLGGFFPFARVVEGPADFLRTFPVSVVMWTAAAALIVLLIRRLQPPTKAPRATLTT